MLTINHHDKAGLLTHKELFNHHPVTGLTKRIAGKHMVDSSEGLGFALSEYHAFAGSKTVCLDHNRCSLQAHVGFGCLNVSEVLIGGGGDVVPGQKVLTESL